ncbi:MAG: HAD family hydrolase [Thiolinea sp.]
MTLALFDLDNTLLQTDSDHAWGRFLSDKKLVDEEEHSRMNDYFYQQYSSGTLDIHEYARFSLKFLSENSRDTLDSLHQQFMQEYILPNISSASRQLLAQHKAENHTLVIITATNSFVTGPIARELGVEHLLAIEPKIIDGQYSRKIDGIPTFREGKVTRLNAWLENRSETLSGSFFYSDSHNDLPLLEIVDHPITVDPDPKLLSVAEEKGWPVMSLKG